MAVRVEGHARPRLGRPQPLALALALPSANLHEDRVCRIVVRVRRGASVTRPKDEVLPASLGKVHLLRYVHEDVFRAIAAGFQTEEAGGAHVRCEAVRLPYAQAELAAHEVAVVVVGERRAGGERVDQREHTEAAAQPGRARGHVDHAAQPVRPPRAVLDRAPLPHRRAREDHRPPPCGDAPDYLGSCSLRPSFIWPSFIWLTRVVDRPELDTRHGVDRRPPTEVLVGCCCYHRDRGADREQAARCADLPERSLFRSLVSPGRRRSGACTPRRHTRKRARAATRRHRKMAGSQRRLARQRAEP
eukprot:scaffold84939_cov54-Phaeocystis_antarctica.AAC.3